MDRCVELPLAAGDGLPCGLQSRADRVNDIGRYAFRLLEFSFNCPSPDLLVSDRALPRGGGKRPQGERRPKLEPLKCVVLPASFSPRLTCARVRYHGRAVWLGPLHIAGQM